MVDRYTSFTDLAQQTTEGEDWSIHTEERGAPHLITAIHGGAIERGTSEVAELIARRGGYDFYTFKATRRNKNNELHVTSRHFNEPQLETLVQGKRHVISIHGCRGVKSKVYLGGLDLALREHLTHALEKRSLLVEAAPPPISGMHTDNFVNCGERKKGVQIELTEPLRKSFFNNKKFNLHNREDESNWSPVMIAFAEAVIEAIDVMNEEEE